MLFNSAVSQPPKITWGPESRLGAKDKNFYFSGASDSLLFIRKDQFGDNSQYLMETYRLSDLTLFDDHMVEIPQIGNKKLQMEEVIQLSDRFVAFASTKGENKNQRDLYAIPLSLDGNWLDIPVLIDSYTDSNKDDSPIGVEASPNGELLLIYHETSIGGNSDLSFSVVVRNKLLEHVHSRELDLPYPKKVMDINKFLVGNTGEIYMLSGYSPGKKEDKGNTIGINNRRYIVFSYSFESNRLKEFDVSLKDKWVIAVTFGLNDQGNLAIGGFYSNNIQFSIAGTFYFVVDGITKKVIGAAMNPFDREFKNSFPSKSRDGGPELNSYYFDHFILNEDGGAYLVGEQYYMLERLVYDPGIGRQDITYYYYYKDIIVAKMSPSGTMNWVKRIPKEQFSTNDGGPYSSYALSSGKGHIDIIFNDNPRNQEIYNSDQGAEIASMSNHKKASVTWVRIDESGEMSRETIMNSEQMDTYLKPKISFGSRSDELVIFSQFRKNYRFGTIVFPK